MVVSVGSKAHPVQWGWCRVGDPSPAPELWKVAQTWEAFLGMGPAV
jgi:hypothetical protein